VAGTLASNWVKGLPPEELGLFVTKVNAVTAQQVEQAVRATFRSGTQTVVVVGDAKKVKGEVELFGPVKDVTP
jgi:predicted Zn-dependent peptidase